MTAPAPLSGLNVVEFTHMVMGPAAGAVLAALGANVVRVEPAEGDKTRTLLGSGAGYFPMYNRHKQSIALDLKSAQGLAVAKRLAASADVVAKEARQIVGVGLARQPATPVDEARQGLARRGPAAESEQEHPVPRPQIEDQESERLLDLALEYHRDRLLLAAGAPSQVAALADPGGPSPNADAGTETSLRAIDTILESQQFLERNVAPQLVLERMFARLIGDVR